MGAWRLRSDYQYTRSDTEAGSEQDGRFSRVYMFRPLPSIGAKLTLGETDFQSSIFDAFTYTGASLISDERMLPWSLRGYAPQITGIAQTNATVTVSLADRVIYQSKVPRDPLLFRILTSRFRARWTSKSRKKTDASTPSVSRLNPCRFNAQGRCAISSRRVKRAGAPPMMLKIIPS